MKNFIPGLTVVLALAVVVLYILHFSSGQKPTVFSAGNKTVPEGNFKVAYFELDSIQNQFDYYKEISSSIQSKAQDNNKQLGEMKNAFANKYQELQKSAQTLTQAELASKQQELIQLEKTFQSKEQMMNNELQDESMRKLQDVKKKIDDFLKEYNNKREYAFIIGHNPEAGLLYYKDSAYDITADLIKGLNAKYKKK